VRPLVEELHPSFAFFFATYVSVVIFAITRIITALFLKEALAAASNDAETVIREKMRERQGYANRLQDVFNAADLSGNGDITLSQFEKFLEAPKVRSYFAALELDASEPKRLFELLDGDGDGRLVLDEFVNGAMKMKDGGAKSKEFVFIQEQLHKLGNKVMATENTEGATSVPSQEQLHKLGTNVLATENSEEQLHKVGNKALATENSEEQLHKLGTNVLATENTEDGLHKFGTKVLAEETS